MRKGENYRIIGAKTDEYKGKTQLSIDRQSVIQPL